MRYRVFFSYSHKDANFLKQFQTMLAPALQTDALSMWDDKQIQPGQRWREEIAAALQSAKVAVLLVSSDFLASEFIRDNELPKLLNAAADEELLILWVYISACMYRRSPISDYQAAHDIARPLDMLSVPRRKLVISEICDQIIAASERHGKLGPDLFPVIEPEAVPLAVASPP